MGLAMHSGTACVGRAYHEKELSDEYMHHSTDRSEESMGNTLK